MWPRIPARWSAAYAASDPSTWSWYRVAWSNAARLYVRISEVTSRARRSAKARRATIELETSRWTSTLPRPRRCARPATWKRPESSASRSHSFAGAIAASSSRRSSESAMFVALEREQAPLVPGAVGAVRAEAAGRDDAMARDEDREMAVRAEAPGGARGTGSTGERRELAVGDDLAPRDRPERSRAAREKRGPVVEVDRHGLEWHLVAREVRLQHLHDFGHEASICARRLL